MPKYLCAPLVALALAVLAAGCGGEDTPTKDEYIADLDKICKESNDRIQKLKSPTTVKGIGPFAREARPILEDSVKDAEDLELPDEDAAGFKAYVQGSKDSLTQLDELEKAAATGQERAVRQVFVQTAQANEKRDAQAKRLGLKQCGSG